MRRPQDGELSNPPLPGRSPFVTRLRAVLGTRARALEFALLTAARTAEIRGARWCEIDFESKTWTVPVTDRRIGATDDRLNGASLRRRKRRLEGVEGSTFSKRL